MGGARTAAWGGIALATVATFVWSGNFVIASALHDTVPPVQTAFWRWIIALAVLAPLALPQVWRQRRLIRRHIGYLTLAALLGFALFNTLVYLAGQTTSATNMAMIAAASPVLMVLFARQRQRLGPRQAAGLLLALTGVLALISKGSPAALLGLDFTGGDLLMLGAAVTFAGYSALLGRRPSGISGLAFLFSTFALGALLLAPAYAVSLSVQGGFAVTPGAVGPLLYVGVLSSALAYFAWNKAIALVGAARAGIVYYLQPLAVALLSFALIGEELAPAQLLAMVPILTGVALGASRTYGFRSTSSVLRSPAAPASVVRAPGELKASSR
ncbi:DMT family transporter [Streptomyces gobiensis]|uniref:DMT family transporter n=1 Tax=Streptomyces gobiensis TaxID=2875706 RepID=UPI001E52A9CB|nr:DMT family transporter [Streptomyces gobiensis]UGY91441.1 DMT family transporter [Streptomyces gobiensis]